MASTYRCRWFVFCRFSSLGMVSFYTRTHFGSILTSEGWAVLEYAGSEPVLQFGRG